MRETLTRFLDTIAQQTLVVNDRTHRIGVSLVAFVFVIVSTVVISFDAIVDVSGALSEVRVGGIAPSDIRAPVSMTYVSEVLTDRRRQTAVASVNPIFDPPDPNIARQQVTLLQQIQDFIDNIRRDPFGTQDQKSSDLRQISAVQLSDEVIDRILQFDEDTWRAITAETVVVLERVMRESIRESDLPLILDQLPSQVALRFNTNAVAVIVELIRDLLRPNRVINLEATENARQAAANSVAPESRSFERGQIVLRAGALVDSLDYEALIQLGLLETGDSRLQDILEAFLISLLVMILIGLYLSRSGTFESQQARFLGLLCVIFLIMLIGARLLSGIEPAYYIFPTAAMALVLINIVSRDLTIILAMGLATLIGVMANTSLEVTVFVIAGSMVGAVFLRRGDRINSYFVAGAVIGLVNVVVITLFNIDLLLSAEGVAFSALIVVALLNGLLASMTALAGIYAITYLFNMPTSLKLVELSQPSQPLLQRLLREAPGTYQHSLQVANLAEQAANAIGANAELVRVAALYHDIGKMQNPVFFVENQAEQVNPHDALDDPYRSADIIIEHVSDGEQLARQYRLPLRLRDFILEHHGTMRVNYFYIRALEAAGDEEAIDAEQFSYPGPKPQSRETALLMLADTCESTVRAIKPSNKAQIAEIVDSIIQARISEGQLDDSGLTLSDVKTTRNILIDMLQGVFHPRINYPSMPAKHAPAAIESPADPALTPSKTTKTTELPALPLDDGDDDAPLTQIPPLRRTQRISAVSDDMPDKPKPEVTDDDHE